MSKLTAIRDKLDKKLFNQNVLGSTVTIIPVTRDAGSYGGYEAQTETEGTPVNTIAVPYNLVSKDLLFQPFGDLQEGDMDIIFRYDTSIDVNYKVQFNGTNYRVVKIEDIPLNEGIVAKIVRVTKEQ